MVGSTVGTFFSLIHLRYGVGSVSGNADTKVTVNKVDGAAGRGAEAAL